MNQTYVHGYDTREAVRLQDQATTLADLLHSDTAYLPVSLVLKAGLATPADFDRGVADLYRTAEADGVFCYTFFKACGEKA